MIDKTYLSDSDIAFMESFLNTHDQYNVPEKDLIGFLCGENQYFECYTQVADAYNLWGDAVTFAWSNK